MGRGTVIALMLLSLAAPARAEAQDADALMKEGLELRRQHHDAEALDDFRRAFALDPSPRAQAQIAFAEQALGRWLEAEADLRKAMQASNDPWIVGHREVLDSGLASIQARLAWLEVTANVPGAEVRVNGARATELPMAAPLRVEAGSLVLEVRAKGYATVRRTTSADPGGSARETFELVPLTPTPDEPSPPTLGSPPVIPPPSPATPMSHERVVPMNRPLRITGLGLLGAGAVGVGLGTYFGVRTLKTKSDRDAYCGPGPNCNSMTGVNLDAEARSLALASTVSFIAGLVAAGGGVVLVWVSRSRTLHDARLAPELGPDRAGVTFGGTF
jgi:hypothetical protein